MQKSTFTSVKNLRYFVPKPNQMTMNKKLLTVALSLTVIPSVLLAQKSATEHTIRANEAVKTELNFNDRQDYEDANRGFIASIDGNAVLDKEGKVSYSVEEWDFLKSNTPQTANPSLWRQSQLNRINGLFEVIPGKLYQVRGFDIANMTFIRSDNGWIIIDVTTTDAAAKAGYDLIKKHVADLPVQGVIFTHPHGDHYGGITAMKEASSKKDFDIIAPKGFMASAQNENVLAGVAMTRRATYMYGLQLQPGEKGTLGCGLGQRMSTGSKGIARPTIEIANTGEKHTIDGVEMEFVCVLDTEAPVEIMIWLPQLKAFCTAEDMTHNMHNLQTLRGAKVRNGLLWSKAVDTAIERYGDRVEVSFSTHHWPTWGNERIVNYWEAQRDMYRYLHDQTLHLANRGLTPDEIAEEMKLPASLASQFNCRGYYGTLSHNVKAQYDLYFGWFDGNPAHLNPLPPSELGAKYVEAIGGADKVLEVAKASYAKGEYRWVATLLDNLVFAEPENKEARQLLADTYSQLGYQAESGPWRNFYLTGAQDLFKKNVPYTSKLINDGVLSQMDMGTLLDYCAIQLNGEKAGGKEAVININFTDTKEKVMLMLNNGVLNHRLGSQDKKADLTMEIAKMDFVKLFFGRTDLQTLHKTNKVKTTGDTKAIDIIRSACEPADPNFNIVLP
jgi:alkyl sulfatase BDS1-like metallo-beta-lactamase superfamily hydrolase